jgi:exonuclease VII large subunit
MKKDDLTQVKNIGPSRMKLLNDSGITTIKQLDETPLEKLAQIESVGGRYAKLIKDAVTEYYGKKPEKLAEATASGKEKEVVDLNGKLGKRIKALNKRFKQAREDLKPLGKKKFLEAYIDFKKRSNTLKSRLKDLDQIEVGLSQKVKKKIIKNVDALNLTLKKAGGKPKKKNYKKLAQEIKSFSKMLRDISS